VDERVEQYAAMPAVLKVRELRYHIARKGQRTLCVTIVTTLLDPRKYPMEQVAKLYRLRWRSRRTSASTRAR
jgi:hypothetical protein